MSAAFADKYPEGLVNRLYQSDCESHGSPEIPPAAAEQAKAWLRRILIEFDSLDQHIVHLQKLYGCAFQYPRPRRVGYSLPQVIEGQAEPAFPHAGRLDDKKVTAILDEGIDGLSDNELAGLLLNPYALYDLFDCIDDVQPDYWIDAIHDFLATRGEAHQDVARHAEGNGHTHSPFPILQLTQPTSEDSWARLTTALASALKETQSPGRHSEAVLSPAVVERGVVPAHGPTRYGLLLAAIACAASLAAIWLSLQMTTSNRSLKMQVAALEKEIRSTDKTGSGNNGIAFHSSDNRRPSLVELAKMGFLDSEPINDDPNRAVAEIERAGAPELRALITELRNRQMTPLDILAFLRSLVDRR